MSEAFGGRRFHSPDEPGETIDLDYPGDGDRPPEWMTDYYEDDYPASVPLHDGEGGAAGGDHMEGFHPYSFQEIVENCITPTVHDAFMHIGKLLVWCLIFRISAQSSNVPRWLSHLISAVTGTVALSHFFYTNVLYLIALSGLSYLALFLAHKVVGDNRGFFVTASCLIFNTLSELFVASPPDWHQVRGAQMILTMKAISLGFDLDEAAEKAEKAEKTESVASAPADVVDDQADKTEKPKRQREQRKNRRSATQPEAKEAVETKEEKDDLCQEMPTILEYFGYTLCPGNSLFGPWTTFSDYLRIYREPRWNSAWLAKITLSMIYGFMFLTISTCWNPWMIPDGIWIWWTAYRDAMSFRASHYFVSYISEASAVTAGFGSPKEGGGGWHVQVTQPHEIEIPGSLTEVVKAWNVPMHTWLKTYCFKKARRYGIVSAVLTTYLASTMLHGLNFQLGAVLLSLGFYTYVEHRFRTRLAAIFDASVTATKKDGFRHREGEFLVMAVNLAFGLFACFNLAYLGVMFSLDNTMEEGYSWRHTLMKWAQLDFLSHWIMLVMFVLTLLI